MWKLIAWSGAPYHGAVADVDWRKGVPDTGWDAALFGNGGHFLQSSHWLAFRQVRGQSTFYARGDGWSCAGYLESSDRLYCPYGPLVSSEADLTTAFAALSQLAGAVGASTVRVEPVGPVTAEALTAGGLRPTRKSVQPALTWVKDLDGTADDVLAEMYASNRNRYRGAAKRGLLFRTSAEPSDLDLFLPMVREMAARTGIRPHADDYYSGMARTLMPRGVMLLYLALHEMEPVASALVLDSPVVRYYLHAGSFPAARKVHAASPLLTQIILDAHRAGQQRLDFCGAAPPDQPDHPWAGFTAFKRSFGGHYHAYAGTWELPIRT
jgi:hypothetical protein